MIAANPLLLYEITVRRSVLLNQQSLHVEIMVQGSCTPCNIEVRRALAINFVALVTFLHDELVIMPRVVELVAAALISELLVSADDVALNRLSVKA